MSLIHTVHAGIISDAPSLTEIIVHILKIFLQFAGALAVLMIIITGMMYVMSTGDENRLTLAKKSLIGSVIGLVVVLLALTIVSQITQIIWG